MCPFSDIEKYYYFLERCTPFFFRAVIFINGSVTYYLKRYDIMIELLSLFRLYRDPFEREYLCMQKSSFMVLFSIYDSFDKECLCM